MIGKVQKAFAIVGLAIAIAAAPAHAGSAERITIEIPFQFTIGDETLPAGTYHLYPSVANRVAMLQESEGDDVAMTSTIPVSASKPLARTKLVFRKYKDQYFLAQIWVAGRARGGELSMSDAEKDLRRQLGSDDDDRLSRSGSQPEEITLVAQR
jgi:hypothetical protein